MLTAHLNRDETTGFGLTMMAQQPPTPTPEVASEERRAMDSTSSGVRDFRKARTLDLRPQEWEASLSLVYATIFTSLESTENARTSVFWVVRTMSFSRKRKSTIWFLVTSGISICGKMSDLGRPKSSVSQVYQRREDRGGHIFWPYKLATADGNRYCNMVAFQ